MSKELREEAVRVLDDNEEVIIYFEGEDVDSSISITLVEEECFETDAFDDCDDCDEFHEMTTRAIVRKVFNHLEVNDFTITDAT